MSYNYKTEKPKLFTEDGQITFLKVRDRAKVLLQESGAFTSGCAWRNVGGDSWYLLACIDRLVELGEIREVSGPETAGQDRVFVRGR